MILILNSNHITVLTTRKKILAETRTVPTVSSFVSGHHWKEPGSLFFTPSVQVFICINKISLSLLFSRLFPFFSLSYM